MSRRVGGLQGQIRQASIALDHVEETLRLFGPEIDMAAISPCPVPTMHHAFRGEVSRIVLESLRTASGPLSTTQITERVMRDRGLDLNDKRLCLTFGFRKVHPPLRLLRCCWT